MAGETVKESPEPELDEKERSRLQPELEQQVFDALAALPAAAQAGLAAYWQGEDEFIFLHGDNIYHVQRTVLRDRDGNPVGREHTIGRYQKAEYGKSVWGYSDPRGKREGEVYFTTHPLTFGQRLSGVRPGIQSDVRFRPSFGYRDDNFKDQHGRPIMNTNGATQRIRQFTEQLKPTPPQGD